MKMTRKEVSERQKKGERRREGLQGEAAGDGKREKRRETRVATGANPESARLQHHLWLVLPPCIYHTHTTLHDIEVEQL